MRAFAQNPGRGHRPQTRTQNATPFSVAWYLQFWGGRWDLNPRSSGPQPDVLTATLRPPQENSPAGPKNRSTPCRGWSTNSQPAVMLSEKPPARRQTSPSLSIGG